MNNIIYGIDIAPLLKARMSVERFRRNLISDQEKIILNVIEIFKKIISSLPHTIYAYGSRVKNHSKRFSDIDLCVMDNITDLELSNIKEIFEESDISVKVYIKRSIDISIDFFNLIKDDLVLISK